jgi:Polyketide cyclase / dehydrase and lipid transport
VIELDPGRRLAMRSVQAPFPMTVAYEFSDDGAGTLVRIRTEGDASGFYRLAGPLLARAVRKGVAGDLLALKARLETA